MTVTIIITICVLLLFAYVFDISASHTKIPSVILLLILGYLVKLVADFFSIAIPDLSGILPLLGTVGLILIVLEGALELELNKKKLPFVGKAALIALLPIMLFSFGWAYLFHYFGNVSLKTGLANAIPLAIISSAIAIPSAHNLKPVDREFVTYESSLSDIIGVIFFNFITLNDTIDAASFGHFVMELSVMLLITVLATLGLAYLLSRIRHHVKYAPIILMIVLIYAISKVYHLPALLFVLLFGLFLGNLDELKTNRYVRYLQPEVLNQEVHKFKELTTEIAFLIRALFFLLFGYLIETSELFNTETVLWSAGITVSVFLMRWGFLKLFKLTIMPLTFIAPRGLITILLFLNIPAGQNCAIAGKPLIIQVIILTAVFMMLGLMLGSQKQSAVESNVG